MSAALKQSAQLAQALKEARRLGETNKVGEYRFALAELGRAYLAASKAEPQQEPDKLDAERYQWLRSQHEDSDHAEAFCVFAPNSVLRCLDPVGCMPGELDEAIDAARKAQP